MYGGTCFSFLVDITKGWFPELRLVAPTCFHEIQAKWKKWKVESSLFTDGVVIQITPWNYRVFKLWSASFCILLNHCFIFIQKSKGHDVLACKWHNYTLNSEIWVWVVTWIVGGVWMLQSLLVCDLHFLNSTLPLLCMCLWACVWEGPLEQMSFY